MPERMSYMRLNFLAKLPPALLGERAAITRLQGIIIVVVILAAGVGGAYFLNPGKSQSSSGPISVSIIETDPVNQVDSLVPANITVSHDSSVTLAIQNHDDAARTFEIKAFNVNQTIGSGVTARVTFTVGQPGVFEMFVPPRPPANGLKASPSITGYLIVT